jgi:hypothetical protein
MAVSIIAWNMQGEKNTGYNDAYPLIFKKILPLLFKSNPNDYWLVYLCEAGNPFNVDASEVTPGAVAYTFNSNPGEGSNEWKVPWGIPDNLAIRGIYSPWQQPNKQSNLRCSVMMMEVTASNARFQFSYDFLKAGSQCDNVRPIVYAIKKANSNNDFSVAGVHNIANQNAAISPTNSIAKTFSGGARGACIVGDMNIAAPIKSTDTWPAGLDLGTYKAVLCGAVTQLGGSQIDWGFQNMVKPESASAGIVRDLDVIPDFEGGKYSGIISSDHEVLYYRIAI